MRRKRNDDKGHVRGAGPYSSGKLNLDRRNHFLEAAGSVGFVPPRHNPDPGHDIEAQSERIGETKAGFFNKYPKK